MTIRRFIFKTFALLIIVMLSISSFIFFYKDNNIESEKTLYKNEDLGKCYGLVVPLVYEEDVPYNSIQNGISNVVNDILRLEIPVYWAASDFSSVAKITCEEKIAKHSFEKGAFIIPYTGNLDTDTMISSIAHDYEYGSEIEDQYPVEMYHLMEPISIECYPLNYTKAAYYIDGGHAWDWLVFNFDVLKDGGFLDQQLIYQEEIETELNNADFNILLWLRRGVGYGTEAAIQSAFDIKENNAIRKFVEEGGGFFGIKYGAVLASSGVYLPSSILESFFKNLPSIGYLALTRSSYKICPYIGLHQHNTITLELNDENPISFGVNKTIETIYENGPVFTWLGKDTYPVATIKNLDYSNYFNEIGENDREIANIEKWCEKVTEEPLWIWSKFGDGKVVAMGDDPTLQYPYRHDRVIHNTVFFATSKDKEEIHLNNYQQYSSISSVYSKTHDLSFSDGKEIYKDIWEKVDYLQGIIEKLDNTDITTVNLLYEMHEERKWDITLHMLSQTDKKITSPRLRESYYDSYQRWLDSFAESLEKLEGVVSTVENKDTEFNALMKQWKNNVLSELEYTIDICDELLELSTKIKSDLEKSYMTSSEEKKFIDTTDNFIYNVNKCYKHITQLYSETTKVYRDLWYKYEKNQALKEVTPYSVTYDPYKIPKISDNKYKREGDKNCIIYVDDDATYPCDGSIERPYKNIQDGIDASKDGDTVYVSSGIYREHVVVSKSIKLIGEDKYTTIIDAESKPRHVLWLSKPYTEVSGFTVQNFSKHTSGGIIYFSSHNTISNNIVKDGCLGIGGAGFSWGNTIENNIVMNNTLGGIEIEGGGNKNDIVRGNILKDNKYWGMYIVSPDHRIYDNVFINDSVLIHPLVGVPDNLYFENNTANGKKIYYFEKKQDFTIPNDAGQIILSECKNVKINNEEISKTRIAIELISCEDVTIQGGKITDNMVGIWLYDCKNVEIRNNDITNNTWTGLWVYDSNKNSIEGNNFYENDDAVLFFKSNNNKINNNNFENNMLGISCWRQSIFNRIQGNNFIDNQQNAYDECKNRWNNNYWDDWSGILYNIPGRILLNFDFLHSKSKF